MEDESTVYNIVKIPKMAEDTAGGFEIVPSANSKQTIHEHAATVAINFYEQLSKLLGDGSSNINIDAIIKETEKLSQEKMDNKNEKIDLHHLKFHSLSKYTSAMEEVIKDNCSKFLSVENLEIAHVLARTEALDLFKKESSASTDVLEKEADEKYHQYLENNQMEEQLVILEASDDSHKHYIDAMDKVFRCSSQLIPQEKILKEHKEAKKCSLLHFDKLSLVNEQKSSYASAAKLTLEKTIEDSFQVYENENMGNIQKSTVEVKFLAMSEYTSSMNKILRDCSKYISDESFLLLHETAHKKAFDCLANKSPFKGKSSQEAQASELRNELEKDLQEEYEIYKDINSKKLETSLIEMRNKILKSYSTSMDEKCCDTMLSLQLQTLHAEVKEELAQKLKQECTTNESLTNAYQDITAQIEKELERKFQKYLASNQRKQNSLLLKAKQQSIAKYLSFMENMKKENRNKFFSEENLEVFHQTAKEEAIQSFKRQRFNVRKEEDNKYNIELIQKELDELYEQYIQHNTSKERCLVINAKQKSLSKYCESMSELSKYSSQEFIPISSFTEFHSEAGNEALKLFEQLSLFDQEPSVIAHDMRPSLMNEMDKELQVFVEANIKKQHHLLSEAQEGSLFKYIFNMEKSIDNKAQNFHQLSQLQNSHESFKTSSVELFLKWIRPVEQYFTENNDLLSKLNEQIEIKWIEFQQENKEKEKSSLCKAKSEALMEYKKNMIEVHETMAHQKQLALEIFHGKANAAAMDVFNKWSHFDLHETEMAKKAKDELEKSVNMYFGDIQRLNEMKLKIENNKKVLLTHIEKAKEGCNNKKRITTDEKVKEECDQEIQRLNDIQSNNELKKKIDSYGTADEQQLWVWNSCPLLLSCGHPCKEDWDQPCDVTCDQLCNRRLECGHMCQNQCFLPCEPCSAKCEWSCDHQTCTEICGEKCIPCSEGCFSPCKRAHACGHRCGGVDGENDEHNCLPCQRCSHPDDSGEECILCCYSLQDDPAIQLECGHIFHGDCCRRLLKSGYNGPRITFAFAHCPLCKKMVRHWSLVRELEPIDTLLKDVQQKALMRLEFEGLNKDKDIVTPGARFYKDPVSFAMARYSYYMCFKCKKPYFGGAAACEAGARDIADEFNPEELVCPGCTGILIQNCQKHGVDYIGFKCRYCCSLARWFCFGNTHFCDPCHNDSGRLGRMSQFPKCPVGPGCTQLQGMCPLKIEHSPTGQEFALGCGICNNINEF